MSELYGTVSATDTNVASVDPTTEPHIVIEADRTVVVPEELREIAVERDHNIETVTFDCPRYWDEHDLSTMHIYVHYRCADGKVKPYPCNNLVVDDVDSSIIHFDWTLSQNATCVKGPISFLVAAKKPDEAGTLHNYWHSRLNREMEVLEGLECDTEELVELYPDIIEQILLRLDDIEQNGKDADVTKENVVAALGYTPADETSVNQLNKAIADKANKSGWTPEKYIGTDAGGNLVEKDAPAGGGESSGSAEFAEEKTELNNPITDIIGTTVANAYTGKLTHKCVADTTTIYNGGMLCNDPPASGVMVGETKFNSSGDGRTETSGNVNVRWVTIENTLGQNDFTFTSGDDVEIFAPGGEITRVDGTVVNATTGGFGDQILHDTTNNKYIVIAEAFVGSENVVFARVATAESANVAPSMEFTPAKELTLTVDGAAYKIEDGLKAINGDYDSVSQYNGDITYVGGLFYWVLTNNYKGWVVLTSADGQNWEFNRYVVPDKGAANLFIEAAIGYNSASDTMLIVGRTKNETGYMVLTAYHVASGKQCTKLLPDCRIGSKPSIAPYKYGFYVGHNIDNRSDYELLFVNTYYSTFSNPTFQTMDVWRVNAWHGVSTQYATIRLGKQSTNYGYIGLSGKAGYANLLLCYGMDGNQFNKNGATFTYDAFEVDALTLKNGNQVSLENAYYDKGLQQGNSGGGGSDSWELIEIYTVTDGDTFHKTELNKSYKKFYIFMNSVYASGDTKFRVMADTESVTYNTRILAQVALTTNQYKYSNIEIEKVAANRIISRQSNQGGNVALAAESYWNAGQNKMAEEYLYFAVQTADTTLVGGTIEIYGIPG